jgi:predicted nucleotidyltransferase
MGQEIEALIERIIAWAREQEEIIAVYLYGSYAHGRTTPLSDIDIAVLTHPIEEQRTLWRLEDHWSSLWPSIVDLHVLNLAPLTFRYEVITNGNRLWADDPKVASIESLILRRYWDERPRMDYIWRQHIRHTLEQKDETEYQEYQDALAKVRAVHQRVRETADDLSTEF